ncbi:NAD(P)H-quinone oxidoreductase [Roseospirillum parvum]|uniref:Putative NAD(P)H quinone oxidoreductase, PIG3 family n=1 Tax=Roseospirillum parvum TaxID=83401 RepID=A0A1G7UR68_9PROT|nr:NAD(P)H-quinone oxidoreductase [Roseospirillum parvum]SDG50042.1 putative NAD(P)H quinone oxidoreductase, PIG3 family [Roseospirillum parvum]
MSDLPERMTFIHLTEAGPADHLVPAEGPLPQPGPGEVLIRVAFAGVNRPDVLQRQGSYPPPPGATDVLGLEVAGTVVAAGPGATRFALGTPVCALVISGGYAAYAVAVESHCLPVPEGFSLAQAAALPETFFTVWSNVFQRGRLAAGETLLVHGGSSGIGTTAIQLAKAFGARVLVTAGSPEKCRACEDLGAERAINYREEAFETVAREVTQGRGVDVILDMVGGAYVPRNLKALADDGRLVQIAYLDSPKVTANFVHLMTRRLTWTGSTLRPQSAEAKAAIAGELADKVWPLLDQGRLAPVIHATFPLAQAAQAHALMESSRHIGKILLECHGEPAAG